MTIPYIHMTAAYLLWAYFLLCLAVKMALDRRKKHRTAQLEEAVTAFFAPGTQDVQSEAFRTVRAACREPLLFDLACDRWTALLPQLDRENYARLYTCLLRLFHDRLQQAEEGDALVRCALLERMTLCQVHSPRLDEFVETCRRGSELEQLWCGRCGQAAVK